MEPSGTFKIAIDKVRMSYSVTVNVSTLFVQLVNDKSIVKNHIKAALFRLLLNSIIFFKKKKTKTKHNHPVKRC